MLQCISLMLHGGMLVYVAIDANSFWDRSSIRRGSNVNWTDRITRMIHMTAVKTPSLYCLSLWMGYIRYVDGTVSARQPPIHCTVTVDSPTSGRFRPFDMLAHILHHISNDPMHRRYHLRSNQYV